ncbi:hypothetical protein WJX79_000502 [Trebouxia sp. C0005]
MHIAERKRFRSSACTVIPTSAQALAASHHRNRQQRGIEAKAANKAQTQQRSSPITGPNGSNGWAWILGGCTLTVGTALPALYLAVHWQQILKMAPGQRTTGILAADGIFILTASLFFYCGHQFGLQRNGPTVPFPASKVQLDEYGKKPAFFTAGPMVELDGTRRAPDFFVPYVSFIILASILTPLASLGYLVWEGQTDLGVSTLGVYVLCLVVQIASESVSLRLGTPMWVQVPQAYQPYRLWQLARGLCLGSALGGPEWLQTLLGLLIVLWVFNYGAQMQFSPWLYRWHLQPMDTES